MADVIYNLEAHCAGNAAHGRVREVPTADTPVQPVQVLRAAAEAKPDLRGNDIFVQTKVLIHAVRAAGKAIPGWIDANPSLVLKLMQSDAAFYYVLDMPAEVTRQSGGGRGKGRGGDDDEPVWTKVGVFPSRPKR